MSVPIDPREFGRLEAEVSALQWEVQGLRKDVKTLLELANKGKGGLWFGMAVISAVSAVGGFLVDRFVR